MTNEEVAARMIMEGTIILTSYNLKRHILLHESKKAICGIDANWPSFSMMANSQRSLTIEELDDRWARAYTNDNCVNCEIKFKKVGYIINRLEKGEVVD